MKRILLFLFTNIAIVLVLSIAFHVVCSFLGLDMHELNQDGINYSTIAVFSLVFGMGGAFISLLLSKPIAKFVTGATVVDGTENESTRWLVDTIRQLAERANISMPEVAIYPGPANAFATGAFKDSALVAVSEDIMGQMTKEELRAVLGHEISHIANGDMVTMTLLQGVLNAFVLFLSRVIAFMVSRSSDNRRGSSMVFYLVYYTLQISLGILASIVLCAYSRRREYAADAGSASLLGSPSLMIAALRRLGNLEPGVLPDSLKAMGISNKGKAVSLFSTHPDIEDRINALENLTR
ncbi:MAG: protease HtpX [Kiritimatiellae bacterium]|nr:protease HtpX [Kiritimatiellia bacterium]